MLILSGILRKFAARPIVKRLKNIFFFFKRVPLEKNYVSRCFCHYLWCSQDSPRFNFAKRKRITSPRYAEVEPVSDEPFSTVTSRGRAQRSRVIEWFEWTFVVRSVLSHLFLARLLQRGTTIMFQCASLICLTQAVRKKTDTHIIISV